MMYGINVCRSPRPLPITNIKSSFMYETTSPQLNPTAVENVVEALSMIVFTFF